MMKAKIAKFASILFIAVIVLSAIAVPNLVNPDSVKAAWLSGWDHRTQIQVTENGGGTKDNYAIRLDTYYNCPVVEYDSGTQFLYRPAVRYSGSYDRTYIATADSDGSLTIKYWDENELELSSAVELWSGLSGNDHDGASIIVLQHQTGDNAGENGTILVVASDYTDGLYSRRSDNAEDISSWGDNVDIVTESSNTAYPRLVERTNGTIWLFYRDHDDVDGDEKLYYRTLTLDTDDPSDDAWSAATEFCDKGVRTYYSLYQESDDIHFAFNRGINDGTSVRDQCNIYYIKFQESDDTWRTADGTEKTLPLDDSDADHTPDSVFSSGEDPDHTTFLFDITTDGSDNPYILFTDGTSLADHSVYDIYTTHYDSGWSESDTGINSVIFYSSGVGFCAGACFEEENPDTIYACCPDGSNYAQLQKWENSGGWAKTEDITQASPGDNIRPSFVKNGAGYYKLLWFYTESYNSVTDWDSMRFAYPGFNHDAVICFKKDCRTDFGDVRFTQSDGETLQPSASSGKPWIEEKTNSWRAIMWINVGTVPADSGTLTDFCYYGSVSATNANDQTVMDANFHFCDHFDDGAGNPNSDKWDLSAGSWPQLDDSSQILLTGSVANYATIDQDTVNDAAALSAPDATSGWEWRARVKGSDTAPANAVGLRDAAGDWTERVRIAASHGSANQVQCQSERNDTLTYTDSNGWDLANYHTWKVTWKTDENVFSLSLEDTARGFSAVETHTTNVSDEDCIVVLSEYNAVTGILYVDWVFARPWTDPEPIVSVSAVTSQLDISLDITTWVIGTIYNSQTKNTGLDCYTVTNDGEATIDITIHATDMTGSGVTWTLSDTATAGDATYGLKAGLVGTSYNIVVRKTETYNFLVEDLASEGTQSFGLEIYAPTSNIGQVAMSGTVTLTASLAT